MPRTVSVKLAADVASYEADLKGAGKATDDLKDTIAETGVASEAAGAAADGLGHDFRGTAGDARRLKNEIQEAGNAIRALAVEYAAASTVIDRDKIAKDISARQSALRDLMKIEKLLPQPAQVEAAGKKIGEEMGSSIGEALSSAPVWAPFAAAAAPLLGATLSAAVIGGAGVGGVIGGVLLAARDPRVAAAGTALGQTLLGQLEKDAAPFVEPVLLGIGKIEGAFRAMDGEIKNIFSVSSGFLAPLEDGVIGAVTGIMRGIDALVTKGKPVIDQLGHSFTQLGNATGDALEVIAGDSGDAAKALKDLTDATSITIEGVGYLVRGLTELYQPLMALPHLWIDAGEKVLGWDDAAKSASVTATAVGTAQKALTPLVLSAGEAAGKAGLNMTDYADTMNEAAQKSRSLYSAQTDVAQAMADAKKAIAENGHTLDINTQKGRDNRKMLVELATKLQAAFEGYRNVGIGSSEAAARANGARDQFIKVATQLGLTRTAAGKLADQMGLIKSKRIDFLANTHDAAARIEALKGQIGGVHGKTVSVNVIVNESRLNKVQNQLDRFRAAGGPVKKGKAYVVGDGGRPEVFVPDRDGTIIPSVDKYNSAYGGGSGSQWQAAAPSTTVINSTVIDMNVNVPLGAHANDVAREVGHTLERFFATGGELRVNGKRILGGT
jgi:hypothetical protein